jgi:hypothetical protein
MYRNIFFAQNKNVFPRNAFSTLYWQTKTAEKILKIPKMTFCKCQLPMNIEKKNKKKKIISITSH